MKIKQTPLFARQKKKLHSNQIRNLDEAVHVISDNSNIGEQKRGDLDFVRVFKFKMVSQECLLAYQWIEPDTVILLTFGSHENFYRDLKRTLN